MRNRLKKSALSLLLALALVIGLIGSSKASVSSYAANAGMQDGETEEDSAPFDAEEAKSEEEESEEAESAEAESEEAAGESAVSESEPQAEEEATDDSSEETEQEETEENVGSDTEETADSSEEASNETADSSEKTSDEASADDDANDTDDSNSAETADDETGDDSDADVTEEDSEYEEDDSEEEDETDSPVLLEEGEISDESKSSLSAADTSDVIEEDTYIPDAVDLEDNDTLFAEYFNSVLYEELEEVDDGPVAVAEWGNSHFPDGSAAYSLYSQLLSAIKEIAANGGSTEISISMSTYFTYTVTEDDVEEDSTFADTAKALLKADFGEVIDCLLVDCPYELYWFDKSVSTSYSYYPYETENSDGSYTYKYNIVTVKMRVASSYQGTDDEGETSDLIVDSTIATASASTVSAAKAVVEEYSDESDYEKLCGYRDWICDAVSYNYDAANSDDYDYGDPWQIIYVFDENPDTKVVCEGYSKAFQYLCDLTDFENDIVSYTVSGTMTGATGSGGHMWNNVKMEDDQYYLVDVTNSDSGTVGQNGDLFLVGNENGSVSEGYTFYITVGSTTYTVYYEYDEDIITLYGTTILTLAGSDYVSSEDTDTDSDTPELTIDAEPSNQTVSYGEKVELTVAASSTDDDAELTYQWYRVSEDDGEDEAVGDASDATLTLTGLDVGTYQYYCIVSDETNDVTATSETVTVTVTEAEITDVSEVSSLVTAPAAGNTVQTEVTADEDADYTVSSIAWSPEAEDTYDYETEYTVTLTLTANRNYVFSDSLTVPSGWTFSLSDDGTVLTLTYTYDATDAEPKVSISGATVSVSPESYAYTGSAIEPTAVTVTLEDGTSLTEDEDYTVSYSDNTNVGTATVTITGTGNYEGTASATFTITGASVETAAVTLSPSGFTYSGETNQPAVTVALDGTTLTEGTDYTVSYTDDLVNVGTVTVTITGTGNYTGTVTEEYTIAAASVADATVTLSEDEYTYNGSAKEPTPSVMVGSVTLTKDTDYTVTYSNNTNIGTATVTITGIGNYTGTASTTFTITAISITNAAVKLSDSTYTYDGTEKKPEVTVTVDGTTLTKETDYTVSYSDNTDVGTATVTITGTGNYTGSTTAAFTIEAASVASAAVTLSSDTFTYDGNAKEPEATVAVDGTTLTEGTDYTVSYSDNTDVGTATVTITGTGNYTGSTAVEFTISAVSISGADVTVSPESCIYTGDTITPTLSVTLDGTDLTEGTDYTVSFEDGEDNVNVGTVTVTVSGTGNYTGSTTVSFEITAASIEDAEVELSESSYTYTGTEKTPSVTVTLSGKVLTEGDDADYTVAYSDNIDAGTATVTITGTGNYTGTTEVTFIIEAAEISDVSEISGMVSAPTAGENAQSSVELVDGVHYTASIAWEPEDAVYDYETEYTATLTLTAADNYVFSSTAAVPDGWTSELSEDGSVLVLTCTFAATDAEPEGLVITEQPEDQAIEYGEEATLTVTAASTNEGAEFSYQWYQVSEDGEAAALDGETDSQLTLSGLAVGSYQYYCIVSDGIDEPEKSSTVSVTVAAKSIADAEVSLTETEYIYSGSVNEPDVTVTLDDGTELAAGTDYTVSYKDNTDAGTATVVITGAGNYAGTVEVTFVIAAASIENAETVLEQDTFTYSGSVNEPCVTVTLNDGTELTAGTNYTVSYENNVNVGTATAVVTGAGNYSGSIELVFEIEAASIGSASLSLSESEYTYSGSAKEPAVSVTMDGTALTEDTDYTVSYEDNKDAGTATVVITGMGNYTGTAEIEFVITEASIADAEVSLSETTYTYSGSAYTPGVTVIVSGTTLTEGTDYTVSYADNVEIGTATVTVTGTGNYTGTASASFTIEAISIAEAEITLSETVYTYSGEANTPEVVVVLAEAELVEGTDYEISYTDNVSVGTATVVVTGIGVYTGSLSASFTISSASIDGADVTVSVSEVTYSGEANRPSVSVTLDGTGLTEGTDYTVTYADNVNVGTATITVTGTGNYMGTLEVSFAITAASIEDAEVTLPQTTYAYTGSELEPSPTVTVAGTILTQDVDYTVTYADNVEIGTATVTITGMGNYTGTTTVTFTIAEEMEEEENEGDEGDGQDEEDEGSEGDEQDVENDDSEGDGQDEGEDHEEESSDDSESGETPGAQSWVDDVGNFIGSMIGGGSNAGSSGNSSSSSTDDSSASSSDGSSVSSDGTTASSGSSSTGTAIGTIDASETNLYNVTDSAVNANAAFLGNTVLELGSLILTEEEQAIVEAGTTGYVYLEVVDCSLGESLVSADEVALVDAVRGDAVIGGWYDISLYKRLGDGTATLVTETNGLVTITMVLPQELVNTNASVVRTYQVARIHGGEVTLLACEYDAETGLLSFQSDRFSKYAILYTDVAASETNGTISSAGAGGSVNGTGDSGNLLLWLALLLVSGAGLGAAVCGVSMKRRRRS